MWWTNYLNIVLDTYLLTPWCRVLLEKLTGLQLVKKFPAFHGTRRFITALTNLRHMSVSWANPIQSIYPHPASWRSILILSTHLRLGLPINTYLLTYSMVQSPSWEANWFAASQEIPRILWNPKIHYLSVRSFKSYIRATRLCATHIAFTDFVFQIILVTTTSYESTCYAVFYILLFLTPLNRSTDLSQTHPVSVLPIRGQKNVHIRCKIRREFKELHIFKFNVLYWSWMLAKRFLSLNPALNYSADVISACSCRNHVL